MNKMYYVLGVLLLVGCATTGTQPTTTESTSSQTRFALACIGTETDTPVDFQVRWGEGTPWGEMQTIHKGKWKIVSYTYPVVGQNHSPILQIRYDDDKTSGVNIVISTLKPYAVVNMDCHNEGKQYDFISEGNTLSIIAEN